MNIHLRNRFQTATATAANAPGLHNNRIRAQTVRNHLRENGLYARRPYIACVLTQRHRQNRLNWPRVHTRWIQRRWMNEYFLYSVVMAVRVYRRRNERYAECCVLKRNRFGGGGSVMVYGYRSPLIVIDGNLNAKR